MRKKELNQGTEKEGPGVWEISASNGEYKGDTRGESTSLAPRPKSQAEGGDEEGRFLKMTWVCRLYVGGVQTFPPHLLKG